MYLFLGESIHFENKKTQWGGQTGRTGTRDWGEEDNDRHEWICTTSIRRGASSRTSNGNWPMYVVWAWQSNWIGG